ncbi:MAG TPA: glycosyltransferase family 2 protein [Thermodesulfovibrionia bacterium]|nr:glycosyltransferase family 2 protein [Thermodesulfovibrionia bacterium]
MMNKPYISIVTAVKNAGLLLEQTILSIMNQTFQDYEHVIIDGVSDDDTLSVITKYREQYPMKFVSEPDRGISDAFNKGVGLASGKWLLFLGAGDELVGPTVLSRLYQVLREREGSLIVWGNVIFKDSSGKIGRWYNGDVSEFQFKRYMCLPHQAAFHNRLFFEKYGLFDPDLKRTMDYDLILRALPEVQGGYYNYDVAYMLVGGQSQNVRAAMKEMLQVQRKHRVFPAPVLYGLFYWAMLKNSIKNIFGYSTVGLGPIEEKTAGKSNR